MTKQKLDPNHPLFKKIIRNRFRALLFAVPSGIGLLSITIPLDLPFSTEVTLMLCCLFFGNGVAYYLYASDLDKELRKDQK
jgi:hypothetical protein